MSWVVRMGQCVAERKRLRGEYALCSGNLHFFLYLS